MTLTRMHPLLSLGSAMMRQSLPGNYLPTTGYLPVLSATQMMAVAPERRKMQSFFLCLI